MFSTKLIAAAAASLSLMSSVTADYNPASQANVAMYYGSGDNQLPLAHFCDSTSVDIIPIGFVYKFPQQGFEANFGNQCWGGADGTHTRCPDLQEDIPYCQSIGKKIILSLGGATNTYQLTGAAAGLQFANFLWAAYGPIQPGYTGPRPLDRGASNETLDTIDIDGFDFDIEHASTDGSAGYIACIQRLRTLFGTQGTPGKKYLITGAPQCPLPEANMGAMITTAQFDMLFIQFYNNGGFGCNARDWADDNPNYADTKSETAAINLNYRTWKNYISAGNSNGAKIYIGLIGKPTGADGLSCERADYGDYISAIEADNLIDAYKGDSAFGGVMLWEATAAIDNHCECSPYYKMIKNSLNGIKPQAPGAVCSATVTSTTTTAQPTTSSTSSSIPVVQTTTSTISTSSSSIPVVDITTSTISSSPTSSAIVQTTTSSISSSSSSSTVSTSATSTVVDPTTSDTTTTSRFPTLPPFGNSTTTRTTVTPTTTPTTSLTSITTAGPDPTTTVGPGPTTTNGPDPTTTGTTTTADVPMTTSTVYTTSIHTVTACPPTVTNCPLGAVVTETKIAYTTVCPVSAAETPAPTPAPQVLTTSTIYATKIYTVTACPPSVANCPGKGSVTTEIVALYTTICPVAQGGAPTPAPSVPAQYTTGTVYTTKIVTVTACAPGVVNCPGTTTTATVPLYTTVYPVPSGTTTVSQSTSFYTIKVSLSSPVAPYPTPSTSGKPVLCGSGYGTAYGTASGSACYPISTATASVPVVKIVEVIPVKVGEIGGNKAVAATTVAVPVVAATPVPAKPSAPITASGAGRLGGGAMIALCVAFMAVFAL